MKNPFGLSFGKLPENFIRREEIIATVMDGFVDEENDAWRSWIWQNRHAELSEKAI